MKIDRQQVVDMLRSRGDEDKASQAVSDLPDQVDTDQHRDKLTKLGINPQDLAGGGTAGVLG